MKKIVWILFFGLFACKAQQAEYRKAEDALDAGREYINACLQGDFSKAAFYAVDDDTNNRILKEIEKIYREKDKEGRQQLRTASININEVKTLSDSSSSIQYSNSFDKEPHIIQVVKRNDTWLVDLAQK
ncbi:MAG: hypothetical protein V4450_14550 [Bacteroidota bacterium]